MANSKVSDLTELTTPNNNMEFYINDSLVSKKMKWSNIKNSFFSLETKVIDFTISDSDTTDLYVCDPNTSSQYGILTATLPSASTNDGKIVKIMFGADGNADGGLVLVDAAGTDKILLNNKEMIDITLFEIGNYVHLYCDGTRWIVLDKNIQIDSGLINRSTWNNTRIGLMEVAYDTLVGSILIGFTVTETGGNACKGVVVKDAGSIITLIQIINTGVFTDNNVLTFSNGATAAVNIPGSTSKNGDTNIYHNLTGLSLWDFESEFYFSQTTSESTMIKLMQGDAGGASYISSYNTIDTDNIAFVSHAGGPGYFVAYPGFGINTVDNGDNSYYRLKIKVL